MDRADDPVGRSPGGAGTADGAEDRSPSPVPRRRVTLAALVLAAVLALGGLAAALGLVALPIAAVLAALVAAPAERLPEGLRARSLRAAMAWAIGLLAVALASAGDDGPLRTVCGADGGCGTAPAGAAAPAFVAYLASAPALGVWLLLRHRT